MVLFLTLIILVTVCGGFTKTFPLRLTMAVPKESVQGIFENNLGSADTDEIYKDFYSISDNKEEELDIISQIQEVDLNKVNYSHFYDINGDTYLLVKTMRHRNKRYTSYLTLCPFKICNMDRKRMRTRRYVKTIKSAGDNKGT